MTKAATVGSRTRTSHELPFDCSSLTRWRQRLGEEQLTALLPESLNVAHKTEGLQLLAQLYLEENRHRDAIYVMRTAMAAFPESPITRP